MDKLKYLLIDILVFTLPAWILIAEIIIEKVVLSLSKFCKTKKSKYEKSSNDKICGNTFALIIGAFITFIIYILRIIIGTDTIERIITFIFFFLFILFWSSGFNADIEELLKKLLSIYKIMLLKILILVLIILVIHYIGNKCSESGLVLLSVVVLSLSLVVRIVSKNKRIIAYINCLMPAWIISLNFLLMNINGLSNMDSINKLSMVVLILSIYSVKEDLLKYILDN